MGIMSPRPNPKDPWPDPPDLPQLSDEVREVRRRRYKEARAAGMSIVEAELFAGSERDIGELRSLVEKKCPTDLLPRILI